MMAIYITMSQANLFISGKTICGFLREEKVVSSKSLVIIGGTVLLETKVLLKSSVLRVIGFADINLVCIESKDILGVGVGEEF